MVKRLKTRRTLFNVQIKRRGRDFFADVGVVGPLVAGRFFRFVTGVSASTGGVISSATTAGFAVAAAAAAAIRSFFISSHVSSHDSRKFLTPFVSEHGNCF